MEVDFTYAGLLLLPLLLGSAIVLPRGLGPLLVVCSVFQATSVMNVRIGNDAVPILAFYVIVILICLRMLHELLIGGRYSIPHVLGRPLTLLVVFGVWGVTSSIVFPLWFSGVGVYAPGGGIDGQYHDLTPLGWGVSNIGQAGYLVLSIVVVLWAAVSRDSGVASGTWLGALHVGAAIVGIVAAWQFMASTYDVWFPYGAVYSAEGWAQGFEQVTAGVKRINATFTEPSNLAAYLVSYVAFCIVLIVQREAGCWIYGACVVALGLLIATTSATAYFGLAGLGFALVMYYGVYRPSVRGTVDRVTLRCAVLGMAGLGMVGAVVGTWPSAGEIAEEQFVEKAESRSFNHRWESDVTALHLAARTGGLGVGLGSNRPSSFATSLLSTVGIPGTLLFALLVVTLLAAARMVCSRLPRTHDRAVVGAVAAGFLAHLGAKTLSQPDLAFPTLWMWIVVLVSLLGNESRRLGIACLPTGEREQSACTGAADTRQ